MPVEFPLHELRRDGDSPGLLVCRDDWDEKDPYKLPQRRPEKITLRDIRPDSDIDLTQAEVVVEDELPDFVVDA